MAYNMYKQIEKIKESLKQKGYKKDIPTDIFGKELMILFGMKKQTAKKWIATFEEVGLIKMEKKNNDTWMVNIL